MTAQNLKKEETGSQPKSYVYTGEKDNTEVRISTFIGVGPDIRFCRIYPAGYRILKFIFVIHFTKVLCIALFTDKF